MEKRGLPLEATKALINSHKGTADIRVAKTLLAKTKDLLPLWIESDTLIQVFKRYFNYLLKKERLAFGECLSPFILISCHKSFDELISQNPDLRGNLFNLIKTLFEGLEEVTLDPPQEQDKFLNSLIAHLSNVENGALKENTLPIATHIAYLLNPSRYPPMTGTILGFLCIETQEEYLNFAKGVLEKGMKPMEVLALLHMLIEITPSKLMAVDSMLNINRKRHLIKKAEKFWNKGDFWTAHEILEEVWCLENERDKKEVMQGVVRIAIGLNHLKKGDNKKGIRVIKMGMNQIKNGSYGDINLRKLRSDLERLIVQLEEGSPEPSFPPLSVV